jgi:hypothetical protein
MWMREMENWQKMELSTYETLRMICELEFPAELNREAFLLDSFHQHAKKVSTDLE